jgi:hypothetical protein
MHYYRKRGKEYVANGQSIVQASTMAQVPSPTPGRVVRVLVVQKVLHQSPTNLILPGTLLGLSFPAFKINAKEYRWGQNGQEESQVNFKIKLQQTGWVEGDPEPAPDH